MSSKSSEDNEDSDENEDFINPLKENEFDPKIFYEILRK
jgi:hypothetical protein